MKINYQQIIVDFNHYFQPGTVISEEAWCSLFNITPPKLTGVITPAKIKLHTKYRSNKLSRMYLLNKVFRDKGFIVKERDYGSSYEVIPIIDTPKEILRYRTGVSKLSHCKQQLTQGYRQASFKFKGATE